MKIFPWDWHYRVGFDALLREKVRQSLGLLPPPVARVLGQELNAYSSFLSVQALVDALEEAPEKAPAFLQNPDRPLLLKLLPRACEALLQRVERLEADAQSAECLASLVKRAAATKYTNVNRSIFEPIFGDSLSGLLSMRSAAIPPGRSRETRVMNAKAHLRDLLLKNETFIRRHYRSSPEIQFCIDEQVGDGSAFAEYWSSELLGSDADKLVLYDHALKSDKDEQDATLVHEVIGHGFFYQLASKREPAFFDHGAMAFVEGWATAVEWELSPRPYVDHYIGLRTQAFSLFDETDADDTCEFLTKQHQSAGLSKSQSLVAINNHFQYPGYNYSYSLGGLWFRRLLRDPEFNFYSFAQKNPWGNLFSMFEVRS